MSSTARHSISEAMRVRFCCSGGVFITLCIISLWIGLLLPSEARAHDPLEITAYARFRSNGLVLRVAMSRNTAWSLIEGDLPKGTVFNPETLSSFLPAFRSHATKIFAVDSGGTSLEIKVADAVITQEEDVEFSVTYAAPTKSPVTFRAREIDKLGRGFGISFVVTDSENHFVGSKLMTADDPRFDIPLDVIGNGTTAASPGASPRVRSAFSFRSYFLLGVEHILTGYDHMLFLAALLVACRRVRTILVIVTCFTLAHSLTLGLAALNVVTISPRVIEPLIAATIVYVALENLWLRGREPKGRGWLTFTFGLIHGFGFASALKETGLGHDVASLIGPLFSFNLGVEMGQITVALVCLPLWWRARAWKPVASYGAIAVSCVVALAGSYWLLQRTVFA